MNIARPLFNSNIFGHCVEKSFIRNNTTYSIKFENLGISSENEKLILTSFISKGFQTCNPESENEVIPYKEVFNTLGYGVVLIDIEGCFQF